MDGAAFGILMGFTLIIAVSTLAILHYHQVDQFRVSINANTIMTHNSGSDLEVLSINCTATSTEVLIENKGQRKLFLETVDIFFPEKLKRNDTDITFTILYDFIDPTIWNSGEVLNVSINKTLTEGNYTFAITDEYGARASEICTIE